MPIAFRCSHCGQYLSISRRKAGQEVTCPQCVLRTRVPRLEEARTTEGDESGRQLQLLEEALPLASQKSRSVSDASAADPAWGDDTDQEEHFPIGRRGHGPETGLDMTPMVDVVMLLLIFFMITASFVTQKSLETTPPEGESGSSGVAISADDVAGESIVVSIDEEDRLAVDDVSIAGVGELAGILATKMATEKKTEMLIETHPRATHGMVVAVTDAGLTAQMQHIRRVSKGDR